MKRWCRILLLLLACIWPSLARAEARNFSAALGMETRVRMHLPSDQFQVRAMNRSDPLIIRIVDVRKDETGATYEVGVIPLEAGTYNLRDYFVDLDRNPVAAGDAVQVSASGILPPDQNGLLIERELKPQYFGHYQWLMVGLMTFWGLLIIPLLLIGRRRAKPEPVITVAPMASLACRLNQLIDRAASHPLTVAEKNELEMLLISYWRAKLKLCDMTVDECVVHLRWHVDAGPVLEQMDQWLYRGDTAGLPAPPQLRAYPELDCIEASSARPVLAAALANNSAAGRTL